jgi:O-antigen ligase
MGQILLISACAGVAAYQLARVPRLWALLLLFVALAPKLPVAAVPGNTTPIRVDDLVIAVALGAWMIRRRVTPPPSPITFFLLLYGFAAAACTLAGIASLTVAPLTGILHVGRFVEYALLYYLFYDSIASGDLRDYIEVVRTSLLLVCIIWVVQHWTHAPVAAPTPWATLYPTFSATYDFGGFLVLTTALLYAVWTTGANRSALTTIALAAGILVTLNSESRSSLLALVLIVAIDVAVRARWWLSLVVAAAAAAAVAVASSVTRSAKMLRLTTGIVAIVTAFNLDAIRQALAADPSLVLRFRNWQLALEHWMARPFTGEGLGAYLTYSRQYYEPASIDGWYVRVLADTGVVGLVTFLLLLAALIWTLARRTRVETEPLRRAIVYGAALAVVAAAVSAVLVDTFVSYKIMGVFSTIVACGTRVAAAGPEPS